MLGYMGMQACIGFGMTKAVEEIGARVKALREAWGVSSQSELARRSGVGQPDISRLEAGIGKRPSAINLQAIAAVFDLSVQDLLSGSPEEVVSKSRTSTQHANAHHVALSSDATSAPNEPTTPPDDDDIDLEDPSLNLQLKIAAKELSAEGRKSLLDYARFVRDRERREREGKS